MANRKSPAAQAIKDMLELGMDITFFMCNVNRIHEMNAVIGIISKEKPVKKVKKTTSYRRPVNPVEPPKRMVLRRSVTINPDGTVAIDTNLEWDWK